MTEAQSIVHIVNDMKEVEEVRKVADAAKNRLKDLTKLKLRKGSKVQMLKKHQGARPYDTVGTVERVNTKTISVNFGTQGKWRVGVDMLKMVE